MNEQINVDRLGQQTLVLEVLKALALDDKFDQFIVSNRRYNESNSTMSVTFRNVDTLNVFTSTYEWNKPAWEYKSVIEHRAYNA